MATEIERKFLVDRSLWPVPDGGVRIRQGYLCAEKERAVRVRIAGSRAYLTVKGPRNGASRYEYEYEIPIADAAEMLDRLCPRPQIEKTRYCLQHAGTAWVIDVFAGDNEGLVVAEVELTAEDERFERPVWAWRDVTDQPRYLNANLIARPYRQWSAEERCERGDAIRADRAML